MQLQINSSIVLSSAGSGKTYTMVRMILKMLLLGAKKIYCITFTNLATNEIQERIENYSFCLTRESIIDICGCCSDEIMSNARDLKNLIKTHVHISTIHSLCWSIMQEFPHEAGISANSRILNEHESEKIYKIAIEKALQELSYHNLRYDIMEILLRCKSKEFAHFNIYNAPKYPDVNLNILIDMMSNGSARDIKRQEILLNGDLSEIMKVFLNHDNSFKESIVTKKISSDDALCEIYKIQKILSDYRRKYMQFHISEINTKLRLAHESTELIYQRFKEKHLLVDYDEIIIRTIKILKKQWIQCVLDSRIDHILVDEAQDNSKHQWKILQKICMNIIQSDHKTFFFVGDVKQSIYSFQDANPRSFIKIYDVLPKKCDDIHHHVELKELKCSFRFGKNICNLINKLLEIPKLRDAIVLGSQYTNHEVLNKNDHVEIWPIENVETVTSELLFGCKQHEINARSVLSDKIANTINDWMRNKRKIIGLDRLVQLNDIMILVRHRNEFSHTLAQVLNAQGIRCMYDNKASLSQNDTVIDLLMFGKFVVYYDDAALLRILMISGYDINEIAEIRNSASSLWNNITQHERYKDLVSNLKNCIESSQYLSPFGLFIYILEHSYFGKIIMSRCNNNDKYYLNDFLGIAMRFEFETDASLKNFLQHFRDMRFQAKSRDDNQSVRIMTIHAAKGLESPIVIMPDMTSIPLHRSNVIKSKNGKHIFYDQKRFFHAKLEKIMQYNKDCEYEEYMRLLYVAITRASNELYMCGYGKVQENSWYDIIEKCCKG